MLAWQVRESYVTILSLAEAEDRLGEAVGHYERLVDVVAEEGDPDLALVRRIDARSALVRARSERRGVEGRRADEELRLKALLGLAPDTPFAVDRATPPAEVVAAKGTGGAVGTAESGGEPSLGRRRHALDEQLARERLKLSRFARLPQPVLRVGVNRGGLDIRSGAYVFTGVDVPLFDWGRARRRSAQLALELSETQQHGKLLTLQQGAELARIDAQRRTLEDRGREGDELVDLARSKLAAQEQLYRAGRVTTGDLLSAQAELARQGAERALDEGRLRALLCRRAALEATGATGGS